MLLDTFLRAVGHADGGASILAQISILCIALGPIACAAPTAQKVERGAGD